MKVSSAFRLTGQICLPENAHVSLRTTMAASSVIARDANKRCTEPRLPLHAYVLHPQSGSVCLGHPFMRSGSPGSQMGGRADLVHVLLL